MRHSAVPSVELLLAAVDEAEAVSETNRISLRKKEHVQSETMGLEVCNVLPTVGTTVDLTTLATWQNLQSTQQRICSHASFGGLVQIGRNKPQNAAQHLSFVSPPPHAPITPYAHTMPHARPTMHPHSHPCMPTCIRVCVCVCGGGRVHSCARGW